MARRCAINHGTHQLELVEGGKKWACANCNWFVWLGNAHQVSRMQSVCWECGLPFKMSFMNLAQNKPKCEECTLGMDPEKRKLLEEYLKKRGL